MRELLRSHEQDIVDRVVLQLRTQPTPQPSTIPANPQGLHHLPSDTQSALHYRPPGTHAPFENPRLIRIAELESHLAELRAANQREQPLPELRAPGRSYPIQPLIIEEGESASSMVETVETLFPGVERSTLV